ncbi:hypothetical protein TanjilG_25741 [Lupinus angustifolius]|uniref:WRKY domain-containing protein n=1 Tax=Lupinus angustifolius TaxID=3871 RepID=A0A1J7HKB1_LUPAN|nr:PREDICTED: probable WRKY transcription factor 2 [Lupinus angustifolius]XP_019440915.1 PREDICTED: probable WRKY transcription factor 2 [Lupinus angustifolius]XP_019440916.1 PREDICTED: probable WRKY transcription factor 2 [Lupinus angustifolius]XP_019440917.1 PREDICTED: probable WRKY transcription factor 2 [Lupinus angustifolius]XP_019440918.1 PREDICTED: probable WRKY transcription factor 2 [Lupinus angustifolius]OIW13262.1 hypothetical protein TanjilG_25741 [Lupinus angustifolius]
MAGIDDNVALAGDLGHSIPSPRTFFSRMLGEDTVTRSISDPPGSGRIGFRTHDQAESGKGEIKDSSQDGDSGDQLTETSFLNDQKSNLRGGLVERMAARAGFNAPRLNTECIRSTDLTLNAHIQSPYLTIPPGLSPTTLLDSPVFLANALAQPSPTTGKFPFISNGNILYSELSSDDPEKSKDNLDDLYASSFAFKPAIDSGSSFYYGTARNLNLTTVPQQSVPGIETSVQSEDSFQSLSVDAVNDQSKNDSGLHYQPDFVESPPQKDNGVKSFSGDKRARSTPPEEQANEEGDRRVNGDSTVAGVGGKPAEDGYNWRKYGQKQVKGSEYPRSYYKCTHPNCLVRKKVERSHEGHITEIIYKGAHNHPKTLNRRSGGGSVNPHTDVQLDNPEHFEPQNGGDMGWANVQKGIIVGSANWKHDNPEVTSSASVGPEYCNQSTDLQTRNGTHIDLGDAVDGSSTFSNEDEDDRGTHGSISLGHDGEEDESESKRRKLESYAAELSGATRAIREPRVVVQTTSEVDILDDGYRWRKYGQKVVKGNPNPRSYYKCTNAGCTVRKHVERASHDLKSVITTYEGKHDHDIPAARSSSHINVAASSTVPGQGHVHRPEPSQVHNGIGRLDRPSLSSYLPRSLQLGPSHSFSFGMNQPMLSNLAMPGFGSGHGKLPSMHVHPLLAQQCPNSANEMGFMLPKEESNVEPIPERGSSIYQEIMNRMALGPHM